MNMVTLMPTEFIVNYSSHFQNRTDGNQLPGNSFWSTTALNKIAPVLLVLIATIIGNSALIILLTHKKSRRRKRVNIFIVNLAVADLTVAFITMTTELLEAVFKQWILGAFLCKFSRYCQGVTLSSTTFMLTGMSIDRYQVIVRPLRSIANRPNIKAKVITAWTLAFIFAIPQSFIFVQVEEHNENLNSNVFHCESAGYTDMWQRKFYFTVQTFHVLVIPAAIMLFCYTSIVRAIWNRGGESSRRMPSISSKGHGFSPRVSMRRSVISSSRQRVVFMTLSVIIAYIVCVTPYFIINLIRIYSHYNVSLSDQEAASRIIFLLHSALNPLLYGFFTIRKRQIVCLCPGRKPQQGYGSNYKPDKGQFLQINENKPTVMSRMFNCLSKTNAQETDVILKNHIAKEETIIKLKNRETCKYNAGVRRRNDTNKCSGRWPDHNGYHSNGCSCYNHETPLNIQTSIVLENSSSITDV